MTETTVLEKTPQHDSESLAHTSENACDQMLQAIDAVEDHLRGKRSRIQEIQRRRDRLVKEIDQLNKTLESEQLDFVPNLSAVISEFETNGEIVDLLPEMATAPESADAGTNGSGRGEVATSPQDEKPAKRGSLRWLKEKERSRWES